MKVSVVIPALNEEGIVGKTVKLVPKEKLKDAGFETEIIVVDNASEDKLLMKQKQQVQKLFMKETGDMGMHILKDLVKHLVILL